MPSSDVATSCAITAKAQAADCFGSLNVGSIYGAMLTAWGLGTVAGSSLLAEIHQRSGSYGPALHILAILALISAVLPLAIRPPFHDGDHRSAVS